MVFVQVGECGTECASRISGLRNLAKKAIRKYGYEILEAMNGDNNLENIRRPDETWKVRLIEEEFKRLMFDVEDI